MRLKSCPHCANKGLLRLCYRSAEPFDLVVCDCPAGQFWRKAGEAIIRQVMRVSAECSVVWREDVEDVEAPTCAKHGVMVADDEMGRSWHCAVCGERQPATPVGEGYTAAGQTGKRAKL